MALDYTQWPTKTTWKAHVDPGTKGRVNDVDTDDTLTFVLDNSSPDKKIKIDTFTCPHSGKHNAYEWEGVYCEKVTSNKVKGRTKSNWDFTIESSETVKNGMTINVLTWSVIPPSPGSSAEAQATFLTECSIGPGGGVCWTAEDG